MRNEEIDRLRRIVEGEMPLEKLVLETQQSHADRMIGQLQSQVDLLQKRNEELEKRMLLRLDAISQSAFAVSSRRERASQCELLKHPMDGKVFRPLNAIIQFLAIYTIQSIPPSLLCVHIVFNSLVPNF